MKHSRFWGFDVITSQRCKYTTAEKSFYSNAFSSLLLLSFPQSLMNRLMFDHSPHTGLDLLLIRDQTSLEMRLSKCRSKTQLLWVKGWRGFSKTEMPLVGKNKQTGKSERGTQNWDQKKQYDRGSNGGVRQIIWEERERECRRHVKGERHEKVSASKSDPTWADEMGDGWGGVRDKSQRGLGPWEPLLLWSFKSTDSQWSTWPLQRAYSSKSASKGQQDTFNCSLKQNIVKILTV